MDFPGPLYSIQYLGKRLCYKRELNTWMMDYVVGKANYRPLANASILCTALGNRS